MKHMFYRTKKIKLIILCIFILLLLFYILDFNTIFDEDYSYVLVSKSFSNIVKLDSLDVHPPLYYFILKSFLFITTFWTRSFLIKIIFSRLLSVIISIITFILLLKIFDIYEIKYSLPIQFLIFLTIPGVISFTYEFTKIRMYSLAALFVVAQFYNLIKINRKFKFSRLILLIILLVLSEYTNYYSAAISGLLVLIYLIKYYKESNPLWKQLLYSLILMIIMSLPWLPILFKQFSYQKYHPLPGGILKQWLATFIFIIAFAFPLVWTKKNINKEFFKDFFYIFMVLIILFIFMSLVSVLYRPVFQFRYFYPIFIIYGYFSINLSFNKINSNKYIYRLYSLLLIIALVLIFMGSYINQIYNINIPSLSMPKRICKLHHNKSKTIYLKSNNNDLNYENSIYISSIHKNIKTSYNVKKELLNPSYKRVFNHVIYHLK